MDLEWLKRATIEDLATLFPSEGVDAFADRFWTEFSRTGGTL